MAINDNPPPPPPVNMEKPFGVTNFKSYVPLVLDLDQLNYDAWSELVTSHCHSFGVHGLLDGTFVSTTGNAAEWKKLDSVVKVWIYARAMELHEELRSLELGTLSIVEYFKKIKVVSDLLSNIESPIDDKNLVMYDVNGLGDKYDHMASIIRHSKNPLTLLETRSMLLLEESHLNHKQGRGHARDTSSSSIVLMDAGSRNNNKGNIYVDQPTTIPHAFNATTLRYADNNEDSGWYMDTGATSHLSSDAGLPDSCLLLRCDSTGDLYPFHSSTITTPIALLSSNQSTWHQRLGHPGDDVLQSGNLSICRIEQCGIRHIRDVLEHGYAVSSLMDMAYW
ncbi:hybrid signal transduction histidine kinase M [Tanacetum coccineum]